MPLAAFCKGDSSQRKTQEWVNGHWNRDAEEAREILKSTRGDSGVLRSSLAAFCKGRLLTMQNPKEESVRGEWRTEPCNARGQGNKQKGTRGDWCFYAPLRSLVQRPAPRDAKTQSEKESAGRMAFGTMMQKATVKIIKQQRRLWCLSFPSLPSAKVTARDAKPKSG